MQAAVQRYIDSSISKTINVPADIPFERFKDVYVQAYALGCKGCTTYRPNEVTGAVLEARPEEGPEPQPAAPRRARRNCRCRRRRPPARPADVYEAGGVVYMTQPLSRPEALPGQTYKVRWPDSEHALYITLNDIIQDGRRRPVRDLHQLEEHGALRLDRGADPHDQRRVPPRRRRVVRRRGDEGGVRPARRRLDGRALRALAAGRDRRRHRAPHDRDRLPAAEACRRHDRAIEAQSRQPRRRRERRPDAAGFAGPRLRQCPKCGEAALIRIEDCDQCTSCGYSKCG